MEEVDLQKGQGTGPETLKKGWRKERYMNEVNGGISSDPSKGMLRWAVKMKSSGAEEVRLIRIFVNNHKTTFEGNFNPSIAESYCHSFLCIIGK